MNDFNLYGVHIDNKNKTNNKVLKLKNAISKLEAKVATLTIENSELKEPTKILSRFAHTARSILLLIVFYFLYLLCFAVFYITHFSFIHDMLWVGMEGVEVLHDWCPLGAHTYHLSQETTHLIVYFPIVVSIVSTIAFNHTNRVVRLILFLLPVSSIVVFLFLHFSCIDSILARFS